MSLTFLATLTQAEDKLNTTMAQIKQSQGVRIIQFANDQLTVKVKDMSLRELLQEITRQSGLILFWYGSPEERITMQFHRLPLDVGLRQILSQKNFAIEYAQQTHEDGKSTVRLPTKLWIFHNNGEKTYPIHTMLAEDAEQDMEENALGTFELPLDVRSVESLTLALSKEKSDEVRQEIIQAMAWLGDEQAIEPLERVLREDQNSDLRESAVLALLQIGGDEVIDPIANAITDKDSTVRELSLIALAEVGSVRASEAMRQALEHGDRKARNKTAELFRQLQGNDEN